MDASIGRTVGLPERLADVARRPFTWLIVAALIAGVLGFGLGLMTTQTIERTGQAFVGHHMASIRSDDTYYGLRGSVAWTDQGGTFHEDGWPMCLKAGTSPSVRFRTARVETDGVSFDAIVYLDCRG